MTPDRDGHGVPDRRAMRRRLRAWAPALPAMLVVGGLFGGALLGAARSSLDLDPVRPGGLDLAAWQQVLTDPAFRSAVGFSVAIAVVGTVLSITVGVAVASALRGRAWARATATLPVLVPHLLMAVVAVLWIGPGGLVDRLVGELPTQVIRAGSGLGIVLVYVVKEAPFLALLVLAGWGDRVAAHEEVAAVHGAGPLTRLWVVVLPAVRTPLVIGTTVVAAYMLGAFEVSLLVGPTTPDTIATYALRATRTADLAGQSVAAAALLVAACASLLVAGLGGLTLRRRHG